MPIAHFQTAHREGAPVLISLVGLSSSGKTYSALKLARGLVGPQGKIGLIDTEEGRAKAYAKIAAPWLWAGLSPPFTPERYVEAIEDAERAGLDCLILDSMSHEWSGEGGILEMADAVTVQGLQKWNRPKARHKKLVRKLLRTRCHVIACFRAKRKFIQEGKGKDATITEAGIVADQEAQFIYETTVQLILPAYNEPERRGVPEIDKAPEDLLPAFPPGKRIDEATGAAIRRWIDEGSPVDHGTRALVDAARAAAERGRTALRAHLEGLTKAQRDALRPEFPNLESIVAAKEKAEADDLRRSVAGDEEEKPPADGDDFPGDRPSGSGAPGDDENPFAGTARGNGK
jgi:hypothetical protein